jgi:hypothetical protein
MSEPKPKKQRGAIDTLVTRDHTAAFWFLFAVITAVACSWYVSTVSKELGARPPFVVMDSANAYYVPPGIQYKDMTRMHLHLTELAAETVFERNESGLLYTQRLAKMSTTLVYRYLLSEVDKEGADFRSQRITQTVQVEATRVIDAKSAQVGTEATGYVRRQGVFQGKEQEELYRFTLQLIWEPNLNVIFDKKYPSLIKQVYLMKLEKVTES